jgi:hypothetical protein
MPKSERPETLPDRPSAEFLRKAAKQLARDKQVKLAGAQAELAARYGYRNWSELMHAVGTVATSAARSPLAQADGLSQPFDAGPPGGARRRRRVARAACGLWRAARHRGHALAGDAARLGAAS